MDRAQTISGIGHLVLILWLLVGDWFWRPAETPPMEAVSVSMVSEKDFQAMQDAAPKADKPAEKPVVKPAKKPEVKAPEPVTPDLPPAEPLPEPAKPEPKPAAAPDAPADVPVSPDPQPVEAPPPVAPVAEVAQPIAVPTADKKPKPRPVDRVAAKPVEDTNDTPDVADTVTPETSDQAAPEAPVVTEDKPAASPEEATTQIVTEDNVATDAPQLAPTSSPRPQSRPEKPVETPTEDTAAADAQAQVDANAALAAALAEASADAPADTAATDTPTDGGAQDVPEGPPMSASEVEGLRVSINKCWNVGTLSSEAMRVTVTIRVEMLESGKPDTASITMVDYSGGSEAAAQQAFEAGRRAVIRCAKDGYELDPAKYGQWNVLNLVFDPSGMRLR
jgi:hypothetical protein